MEFTTLLFAPLIVGVILLVVEYWVIQPSTNSPVHRNLKNANVAFPSEYTVQNQQAEDESASAIFYKLSIGVLGGSGGIASAIIVRMLADDYYYPPNNPDFLGAIADLVAHSNFVFGLIALFSLAGSVILAYLVDEPLSKNTSFLIRVIAAIMFGVIGGFLILILIVLVAIIYFIYMLHKGSEANREKRREER